MDASGIEGIAPETWNRLAGSRAKGDALVARLAVPGITDRLVAAVDVEGKRHLLVTLVDSDQDLADRDSRGIDVATRYLVIQGRDPARYIDLTCNDAAGHAVFDLFGGELAATLANTDGSADAAVSRLIGKWRRFWGHQPLQLLNREEQLGLFAELWFLSRWLIPKVGVEDAVLRWRGPFGARHDFEAPGESVEVKSTSRIDGLYHRINGIEQLSPPENGTLLLFSLKVREEAGAITSLTSLVQEGRTLCLPSGAAISHFDNALAVTGFVDAHAPEYSRSRFRVASEKLFAVREGFPRLTPEDIISGVPAGVDKIAYDINLELAKSFQIADRPADY